MKPTIIDYGVGNLASVRGAIRRCGRDAVVSDNPADLSKASHVILPGVGAFSVAMDLLQARGWVRALTEEVLRYQVPLLGICLGMQLLGSSSTEGAEAGGQVGGLDFVPGRVTRLIPVAPDERVPHVGWSEVHSVGSSTLLAGIEDLADFYFVHSYHLTPDDDAHVAGTSGYCGTFCALVGKDNVYGCQFHPEKSSKNGLRLLSNFLTLK